MAGESRDNLVSKLRDLAEDLGEIVDWKWDGRFGTVLGEVSDAEKDQVIGILERHLDTTWDSSSVKEAPESVQEIARSLGGLMSGQLLLLSDSKQSTCIFCAWWPWGSGAKVSIRIAPFSNSVTSEESVALTAQFRSSFKI